VTAIDHEKLERLAREMCDSRMGAGHWDKRGTKRNYWRKRVLWMAQLAETSASLLRACGWPV
jgi:hypothetical protein